MDSERQGSDETILQSVSKHYPNSQYFINLVGTGCHADGYIGTPADGKGETIFIRRINPIGFGHETPAARLYSMLEAREKLPNTLNTYAILLVQPDGKATEVPLFSEVLTISEILPPDALHLGTFLRQQKNSVEEHKSLAEQSRPIASAMTELMADIHSKKFEGDTSHATSLYQRACRAIIHDPEMTAGVIDFANPPTPWMTHEDALALMSDMERVRFKYGNHPDRLRQIHGDFWTNNANLRPNGDLIITDGRLTWGDPAIDAGWVIGEFLMQDLVRFGSFGHEFTDAIQSAMQTYVQKTNDTQIYEYMHLPYAFQTLAESTFTPNLTHTQRRSIFATGVGSLSDAIDGAPFSFQNLNLYTQKGLDRLKQIYP